MAIRHTNRMGHETHVLLAEWAMKKHVLLAEWAMKKTRFTSRMGHEKNTFY